MPAPCLTGPVYWFATLTVALYVYAKEQGDFEIAFAIAAILMALTVIINLVATLVGKYYQKRRSI